MNAFDLLGLTDDALASVYRDLFSALNGQALQLASLLILFWIIYLGFAFIVKKEAPSTSHIWRLIVMSVYLQFALKWGLFATFWAPLLTEWPFEAASAVVGGGSIEGVFGGYTMNVNNTLSDLWQSISWREVPQLLVLAIAGFLPIALMTGWVLALLIISKVAIATLMVLLPIFILFGMFEATQNLFVAVVRQLLNFMLIPVLLAALLLISNSLFEFMAADLSQETGIQISKLIMFGTMNLAIYQLLRQVPLIAAGIAGGMLITGSGMAGNFNQYARGRVDNMRSAMGMSHRQAGAAGTSATRPSNAILNATQSMGR